MKRSEAPLDQPEAMQVDCPAGCDGGVEHNVRYVSHDMASDAGEPSMVGMEIDDPSPCPRCDGRGWISRRELEDGK